MTRTRWILATPLLASAMAVAQPLQAQAVGEVVQATPSAAAVDALNRNLASLSRNPQDVTALLGAGEAALNLGDVQAANGFYTRANMVNPRLGKAKLGLAIVQIALKQPSEAASNFDAAEALGERADGHLANRGLAYDLTGQQAKAQVDYQAALRADPSNEMARLRYAVSLGISGRVTDADQQLQQGLASGDRESWRMRAFIFAMNGRIADSRKVTQAVMPKGLADALDPYMQRLSLLTASQKASAAYYGEFPSNVLRLAAPEPTREREVQVAAAAPETNRRDRRNRASSRQTETRQNASRQASSPATRPASATPPPASAALTPPPPPPAPTQSTPNQTALNEPQRQPLRPAPASTTIRPTPSQPVASPPPTSLRSSPASQRPSQPGFEAPATVALTTSSVGTSQGPADPGRAPQAPQAAPFQIAQSPAPNVPSRASSAPPAPVSAPQPGFTPAAEPVGPRSLAEALSALTVPDQERQTRIAAADMNAVARIQEQRRKADVAAAAKAKADAEAKAKADAARKAEAERKAKLAANPSRNWVQVATGRDIDALAFDLRRLRRTYADAIGEQAGWTAQWGATRRLLIGPFRKPEDARAVVAQIVKSGGDAFMWQSEAGEEVAKIGGK